MENDPVNSPQPDDSVETWLRRRVGKPIVNDGAFSATVLSKIQQERKVERRARIWPNLGWSLGLVSAAVSLAAPLMQLGPGMIQAAAPEISPLISAAGQLLSLGTIVLLYWHRHYLKEPLAQAGRVLASIRLTY